MSNFTPTVSKTYKFEGDTITVEFSRLKRMDVLMMMPKVQQAAALQIEKDEAGAATLNNEVLNDLLTVLPDYVKKFDGLTYENGEPIKFEDAVNEMYFIDLITDIGMDVMNSSMVVEGAEGKNA
jgi:hypothetical protein